MTGGQILKEKLSQSCLQSNFFKCYWTLNQYVTVLIWVVLCLKVIKDELPVILQFFSGHLETVRPYLVLKDCCFYWLTRHLQPAVGLTVEPTYIFCWGNVSEVCPCQINGKINKDWSWGTLLKGTTNKAVVVSRTDNCSSFTPHMFVSAHIPQIKVITLKVNKMLEC